MLQEVSPLQELTLKAESQGYLTFAQVSEYLPDEAHGTETIDALLALVEKLNVDLVDDSNSKREVDVEEITEQPIAVSQGDRSYVLTDGLPQGSSDPIRMYLSQMAEIPLLTRDEEIGLAKKIEFTRKRFRRNVLRSFLALDATVRTLERVHSGELPFDRTIKVSLTERLTKEEIQSRMPHNLPLIRHLMREQRTDFGVLISRRATSGEKAACSPQVPSAARKNAHARGRVEPSNTSRSADGSAARGRGAASGCTAVADWSSCESRTRRGHKLMRRNKNCANSWSGHSKVQPACENVPVNCEVNFASLKMSNVSFPAETCAWLFRSPKSIEIEA